MIFNPFPVFNVQNAIQSAFVKAGEQLAIDFLAEENKPWTYYVGSVLGHAAEATGIPGAAAVLYVVGDSLDYYILKTPEGSDVRIFLNGVEQTSLATYAATSAWELVTGLVLENNRMNEVVFMNDGPSAGNSTGISWMTLGPINAVNGYAQERLAVPYNMISIRTKDSELDSPNKSIPIYIPQDVSGTPLTLAQVQAWSDLNTPKIDAILDSQIVAVEFTISLTLPGGIKSSPANNVLNERGGLMSFSTTGPRNDSVWFPGFKKALLPGDTIITTDAAVAAVVTLLTTATTAANIRPLTSQDYQWAALLAGKRAMRK